MSAPTRVSAQGTGPPPSVEQLRLMTKVGQLYFEQRLRQADIARRLHLSQARVSRLLKQAEREGIVRTTVVVPDGVRTALEETLECGYGLREVVVVECGDSRDEGIARELGIAAAAFLEATLTGGDVVGLSSWSATLLAAVDSMRLLPRRGADEVVQLFGGVGNPAAVAHASRLMHRFADLTGARPKLLLAPGIAASPEARDALMQDRFVLEALAALDGVTLALVGIGSLRPSSLLESSGNIFSEAELQSLADLDAVGDICLRFFGADGGEIDSALGARVIGVTPDQLRQVERSVGVAGGTRKYEAIRGALLGRWINVLITDHVTAERLVADLPDPPADDRQLPGGAVDA